MMKSSASVKAVEHSPLTLFLCGDVMTGRGVDQLFPQCCPPRLYEPYCKSALDYVQLTERHVHHSLTRPVSSEYIWGDALEILRERDVDVRVVNLETAVTLSEAADREKEIHYRMHPTNTAALSAAQIDVCVLSNNHVLDWGAQGLCETLSSLHTAQIHTAGAGRDLDEALSPAVVEIGRETHAEEEEERAPRRVLVFGRGMSSSGVPLRWAATPAHAGVAFLPDLRLSRVDEIAEHVARHRRGGAELVVFSVHWGGNWDYTISPAERDFAHALIDRAGVDVVHGHSSHHVKGVEMYRGRVILYGCGDFLNDYEGIAGYEYFRADLALMYFVSVDAHSRALRLAAVPTSVRALQVRRASPQDALDLLHILQRECAKLDTRVDALDDGSFTFSSLHEE